MRKPTIPNYELFETIGQGSTGEIWRAEYLGKGPLTVKCLRKDAINLDVLSDALVKIFKSNDFPGIAKIYDFNISGNVPFITYKLYSEAIIMDNGITKYKTRSLNELSTKVSYEDSWLIALKVAESLKTLHSNDLYHCNLKPNNILFDGGIDPSPMLTDFAQGYLGGNEQINLNDSLFFSHPNQLNGESFLFNGNGQRWDIYSFGATMFKLLTGNHCRLNKEIEAFQKRKGNDSTHYSGISPNQVARAVKRTPQINWPLPPSSKRESSFRKVIEQCLTLDENEEFSDIDSVIQEIKNCNPVKPKSSQLPIITNNLARKENRKRTPSSSSLLTKSFIGSFVLFILIGIANLYWLKKINDQKSIVTSTLSESDKTAITPINTEVERPLDLSTSDANTLDKTKLEYLFNDLQESQSALNEICQMIVERDHEGNALYDIPEGTVGTILTYYEKFIERKENENEPALRDSIITALNNSSELNLLLGDYESAIEKLNRASTLLNEYEIGGGNTNELIQKKAKIFENLSTAYSGNKEPKASISASKKSFDLLNSSYSINKNNNLGRDAAKICITISKIHQSIGELENSKRYADQALTILDEITKDSLLIEKDQYLYASTNLQLGLTLGLKEEYSQSREYLELAIAQFGELVTAIPENINYQFHVAKALGKVAEIAYNTGDEEAEAINNYSIELLNNLILEKPKDVFKYELSKRYYSVAIALDNEGEDSAARTQANLALNRLKEIRKSQPSNVEYQIETARVFRTLAQLHEMPGDTEKTIAYSREALSLSEVLLETDRDVENDNSFKIKNLLSVARDYGLLGRYLANLKDQFNLDEATECIKKSQIKYKEALDENPSNKNALKGYEWATDFLSKSIPKKTSLQQ